VGNGKEKKKVQRRTGDVELGGGGRGEVAPEKASLLSRKGNRSGVESNNSGIKGLD